MNSERDILESLDHAVLRTTRIIVPSRPDGRGRRYPEARSNGTPGMAHGTT